MKKTLFLLLFAIVATVGFAQEDKAMTARLEGKYEQVKYKFLDEHKKDGFYEIKQNGKYGVCDISGKEIIAPNKYEFVTRVFNEEGYRVKIGEYWGWCNLKGKEIIAPTKYTSVWHCKKDNIFIVRKEKLGGVCNSEGKEIIPCKYDELIPFNVAEGVILLKLSNKYGYADTKGNILIDFQYESAESFKNGVAMVSKDGSSFLISNPLKDGGSKTLSALSTKTGQARSAVDTDIPTTSKNDPETFVFIIANENYDNFNVTNVKKQSVSTGKNVQTPKITVSDKMMQQWQNVKF